MNTKRSARKGNPDLRQQKHVPAPPIEEIEKQLYSLRSPASFKRLKLRSGKDEKKLRRRSPAQASQILTLPVMMVVVLSLVYRQIAGLREVQRVLAGIQVFRVATDNNIRIIVAALGCELHFHI